MDTTFSRDELRALDPETLRGLLDLAEGDTDWKRAMSLGLDPTNPRDRMAVLTALETADDRAPMTFSAPVGAGESGIRSDLTGDAAGAPAVGDDQGPGSSDGYGLPQPDAEGAADLARAIATSAERAEPFMAGTFALYGDPSGAVVLVVEDAAGNVKRSVVPRKIVRLALGLMSGERSGMAGFLAKRLGRG